MAITKQPPALERAIQAAGGISQMARELGLSGHTVIQQWRSKRVPAEWCPLIEELTGVTCEELRPDVAWHILRENLASKS